MKNSLIKHLWKQYLSPELPFFTYKGDILYSIESDYLLQGICFESSSFSSSYFTITIFVQPLFVPCEYLFFNFGGRLGTFEKRSTVWWDYSDKNEEEIMSQIKKVLLGKGMKFFAQCKTINGFYNYNKSITQDSSPASVEAICYSLVLLGKYNDALKRLIPFKTNLEQQMAKYPKTLWLFKNLERVDLIIKYLEQKENSLAIMQLNDWRNYTICNLKLE